MLDLNIGAHSETRLAKIASGRRVTSNRTSLELKLRTCAIAARVRVSAFNRISSVGGNSDSRLSRFGDRSDSKES